MLIQLILGIITPVLGTFEMPVPSKLFPNMSDKRNVSVNLSKLHHRFVILKFQSEQVK